MSTATIAVMTTTELAHALQLTRQRVLVLARQGRIVGARRLGGFWVFFSPCAVLPPTPRPRKRKRKS